MNIAVMVSGSGTNLQRILDAIESGGLTGVQVQTVIADRDCYALERGIDQDISTYLFERNSVDQWTETQSVLVEHQIDLIVLAGFLSIIPADFIETWSRKIINIHPSLLPKYGAKGMYGDKVHQSVIQNNETQTGATVHWVTTGIDEGEIILQKAVDLSTNDTPESCAQKVHAIEHEIYPLAIQKVVDGIKNSL